ncbi:MAG: CDP-alcohol phosphatidyltransferase family protein [Alphaproteobacteria bacterium]|nr:CDP-alcohol phosphatidyltransferase family protein [Alphaproteobacteria bacterium]
MTAPSRLRVSRLANLAGALTLARVPLAVLSSLVKHDREALLAVLVVAALTDVLDGPVARWRGTESRVGAIADAWGDKIFFINFAWCLELAGYIPGYYLWAWFIRELIQGLSIPLLALRYALSQGPFPQPLPSGRVTTIAVAVAMVAVLVEAPLVRDGATVVAAVSGSWAAARYMLRDRPWRYFIDPHPAEASRSAAPDPAASAAPPPDPAA